MKTSPLILVVDDEPDIRGLVEYYLSRSTFRVRMAGDGAEALASVDEETPDLMVLDLMLPGMTGWDILRELRRHPRHATLPVVLLSARREEDEDRTAAVRLGAADYITKPFSPGDLVRRIEAVLGRVLHPLPAAARRT